MKSKAARILSILISVLVLFASCGQIADVPQGYAKIRVGAPSGRAITADEKQNARFEFYFNDTKRDSNETVAQVGTSLRIKVVAIDARNGRQVATGEKTITVAPGMNNVNIVLREDRGADANMVRWSAGLATVGKVENMPAATSHAPGDVITVPPDPTWVHAQTFNGWSYGNSQLVDENDSTISGNLSAGDKFKVPDGGVTLTAEWNKRTYSIVYNDNYSNSGGTQTTSQMPPTENITALENATVPDVELNPVQDDINSKNYTFTGYWLTDSNGTDGKRYRAGDTIPMTADITLYAQWSDEIMYTVTFTNPSSGSPSSFTQQMPTRQRVKENESSTWTNPAAAGWTFEGWDVSDTDRMQLITTLGANITSYTPTANVTLQAKWTPIEYTVKFNSGNGSTVNDINNFTVNGNDRFAANPTYTGYTFGGWQYNSTPIADAAALRTAITNGSVTATGNNEITLTAQWTVITYKVKYEPNAPSGATVTLNGAQATTQEVERTYRQSFSWASNMFTAPTGYSFAGWREDSNGTGALLSGGASSTYTLRDADITVYAQWTPNTYNITYYDVDAGSASTSFSGEQSGLPQTHTYGSVTNLANPTTARKGFTFEGWYTDNSGNTSAGSSLGATAYTTAIKLYAKWTLGIDMVEVTGDVQFTMGGNGSSTEEPEAWDGVTVSTFKMGRYEITQAQWEAVVGNKGYDASSQPSDTYGVGDAFPMYYISWNEAVFFCNKLSKQEGRLACYYIESGGSRDYDAVTEASNPNDITNTNIKCDFDRNGYRLPTEAEWEYAARGGSNNSSFLYSGSYTVDEVAWYKDNSNGKAHEVRGKTANALGIYDMSGNVSEWCWDWKTYGTGYATANGANKNNPTGETPSGNLHVVRGGQHTSEGTSCTVSYRGSYGNASRSYTVGFRVVCRD